MATVEVKNLEGQTLRDLQISDEVFGSRPNQSLLWEAVKQYLASQRRGTHKTKSRGEVSGGGKKPWRQKGTGRARVGSNRSSLWRHGSIAHGPQPRDYSYALPKGMLRGALRSALAAKFQDHKLTVVDQFNLGEPKTKGFFGALHKAGFGKGSTDRGRCGQSQPRTFLAECERMRPGAAARTASLPRPESQPATDF